MIYLLELQQIPIFEQLQLEEALLRTDERSFCIINRGSPRAIVMGLSGIPEELLDLELVRKDSIPVIKRYSGGGTVIIDEETLFITFLFAKKTLPIAPFPESILRWSTEIYQTAWQLPHFSLSENDYTLKERKCGGNAQYIRKDRWMHHTSFLWDYKEENMDYLHLPQKRPAYRLDRSHSDFLCRLKEIAPSQQTLIDRLKQELVKRFDISPISQRELASIQFRPHRQATHSISL